MSDQSQRQHALDPTQSFIVQAPAGSGKTTLLVSRLLALLAQATTPEECLCITFTRKAAREMRERLLTALLDNQEPRLASLVEAVLLQDQKQQWNLLENPNRLKILTFDAFCASIVQQMPIVAKWGAPPQITEDPLPHYQAAAQGLLTKINRQHDCQQPLLKLLLHLDNQMEVAERLLVHLLQKRDQWLPLIVSPEQHQQLRAVLSRNLVMVIEDQLQHLCDEITLELPVVLNRAWPSPMAGELSEWREIADLLLTSDGKIRKQVTEKQGFAAPSKARDKDEKAILTERKNQILSFLKSLAEFPELIKHLHHCRQLPQPEYSEGQWEIISALLALLPWLVAELIVVFQQHKQVDFTEIALRADRALGELDAPSELMLRLDYQINHILVDEFQDTSQLQNRLLEQLTAGWSQQENRSLFLVGDPMQSIYRFRQAEVGLFLTAWEQGLGEVPLQTLKLTRNFRSDPQIVEFNNQLFSKSFPQQPDVALGAVSYSDSVAAKEHDSCQSIDCFDFKLDDWEEEAKQVVESIQQWQQDNPNDSIAILTRSRSHLAEIVPALQEAGIAFSGVDLDPLCERQIILDALSLFQAYLHPGDQLAWLSLLRSPLVNFQLDFLLQLISEQQENEILWDVLLRSKLSNSDKTHVLQQGFETWCRQTPYQWFMKTWQALGGPIDSDLQVFCRLLENLDWQHALWEERFLSKQVAKLYAEPDTVCDNAVQIMTIHKAKGLEFDGVILPGLGRKPINDPPQLFRFSETIDHLGESRLLLAALKAKQEKSDHIYDYLQLQDKTRAAYESIRLMYVACTRAKKRLCLLGQTQNNKAESNSLLGLAWPGLKDRWSIASDLLID